MAIISLIVGERDYTAHTTFTLYGQSTAVCENNGLGKAIVNVSFIDEYFKDISFNVTMYDIHSKTYLAQCKVKGNETDATTIPGEFEEKERENERERMDDFPDTDKPEDYNKDEDKNKDNQGQAIDIDIDFDPNEEKQKENEIVNSHPEIREKDEIINYWEEQEKMRSNLRKLEIFYTYAECYVETPEELSNLDVFSNTVVLPPDADYNVHFVDFSIIADHCIDKTKLSFRQLNHFNQNGDTINFSFYALSYQRLEKYFTFEILVILLLESGQREEQSRKSICELQETVEPKDSLSPVQADFECSIEGLTEQYSLEDIINCVFSLIPLFSMKKIILSVTFSLFSSHVEMINSIILISSFCSSLNLSKTSLCNPVE